MINPKALPTRPAPPPSPYWSKRLYELITQLKTEVEKTDSTAVLSVALVKKAEEIEKLAKQIKERARG